MCASFFISSLFIVSASAGDIPQIPVPGVVLVQSRLRGSARKSDLQQFGKDVEPVLPSGAAGQPISNKRYSDDDESCSAEGITPGVCALVFLTRPQALTATSSQHQAGKQENSENHAASSERDFARDKLENALIAEIESALADNHTGFTAAQLRKLEQELQPIFATLPHNTSPADGLEGGLDYPAARYLLHQHFVRTHSWSVRGLNPAGDIRLPPNLQESLRSRVAGHLLELMQERLGKESFKLKTLAIFVATLEHLLQGDQHELLKRVWLAHGLQRGDLVDGPALNAMLEMYLAQNVQNSRDGNGYMLSLEAAQNDVVEIREIYAGWDKVVNYLKALTAAGVGQKFSLKDASLEADKLLQFFGGVSGSMCHDMEQNILNFSGGDQGLVNLADLRKLRVGGAAVVAESDEYLRLVGALVEGTGKPLVAVPNYMLGATNCDMSTSFYDLCCPNACESHKEHLERAWASAKVRHASVIAEAVQQRLGLALPADMLKLLDDIAAAHGGIIPIHGRAFADWLHQVFPRDCPRTRSEDFRGAAGDLLPDANAEFQSHISIQDWNRW